jgi:hypothetical protein
MRMSLLPLRACGLALACSAVLGALSLCAPTLASAEQVSYQQVTPVGPYEAVPSYQGGYGNADYVTPDGSSVFFSTNGPFPGLPDTGGRLDVLRASRGADGAWSTTWMSPGAGTFFEDNNHDRDFEAASTNGTKVVFTSHDQLDPSRVDCGSQEQLDTCFLRVYEYDSSTGLTSLISRASVQPNALFDARFASASPDLGRVTWLTDEAMTPGVEDKNSVDLYSSQGGASALVSALSGSTGSVSTTRVVLTQKFDGRVAPFEQPGSIIDEGRIYEPLSQVPARNAHLVSADGSAVFFQDVRQLTVAAPGPAIENVYMRVGDVTTLISSAAQRTLPTTVAPSDSFFGDATPDGRSVFFETASQLTDGDGNASVDVYRYDVPTGQVSLVSAVGNTQSAAANGTGSYFVTASADGSHVYLASRDDLDPNSAPPGRAWKLYERVGERTRFIALDPELARLENDTTPNTPECGGLKSAETGGEGGGFGGGGCDQVETMRATATGSRLIFESSQPLTPDAASGLECLTKIEIINNGEKPGQGCNIYIYDDVTGTITLLSRGTATDGAFLTRSPALSQTGADTPTWPLSQPSLMSEDGGRVFFSSRDALLPGAVGGLDNIYMWSEGALILVSPPNETSDAIYDGNSTNGSQVFFHSRQSLIPGADNHGQFAIYDAQIGGDPPPEGPSDPPAVPQQVASAPVQALTVNAAAVPTPPPVAVSAEPTTPPLISAKPPKPLTRAQELARALKACKAKHNNKKRAECRALAVKKYAAKPKAKRTSSGAKR